MDCFFAAVELRDRPDLKNKPLAVGGRPESRGVIATCNYIARESLVHSALSSREAIRRCPQLIIMPPRFSLYKKEAERIRSVFRQVTSLIEPLSLDEAYLDVSENQMFSGNATNTASWIRKTIYTTTGLTASAGIARTKFLAKIASDWNKPNGQLTIQPHEEQSFINKLSVRKLPGVGKMTQKKLSELDIRTCHDLQKLDLNQICHHFGKFGERLYDLCRGIDNSKVKNQRQRKSLSVENTFSIDLDSWPIIFKNINSLHEELLQRLKKTKIDDHEIKSIFVKFKTKDFQNMTREKSTNEISLNHFKNLAEILFLELNQPIRLIGLGFKIKHLETKKVLNQLSLDF
jgi:DNA polymerase IV